MFLVTSMPFVFFFFHNIELLKYFTGIISYSFILYELFMCVWVLTVCRHVNSSCVCLSLCTSKGQGILVPLSIILSLLPQDRISQWIKIPLFQLGWLASKFWNLPTCIPECSVYRHVQTWLDFSVGAEGLNLGLHAWKSTTLSHSAISQHNCRNFLYVNIFSTNAFQKKNHE